MAQNFNLESVVIALACLSSSTKFERLQIFHNSHDIYKCDLSALKSFWSLQNSSDVAIDFIKDKVAGFSFINDLDMHLLAEMNEQLKTLKDNIQNSRQHPKRPIEFRKKFCETGHNGRADIQLTDDQKQRISVKCENNKYGDNWIVIARRYQGSVAFTSGRDMEQLLDGFEESNGEYFLGLRKIHAITSSSLQELLIVTVDKRGVEHYKRHSAFSIAGEKEFFHVNLLGDYESDTAKGPNGRVNFGLGHTNEDIRIYIKPKIYK